MINTTKAFDTLKPLVVLTKLMNGASRRIFRLAENSTKIALLSGTKSVIDSSIYV